MTTMNTTNEVTCKGCAVTGLKWASVGGKGSVRKLFVIATGVQHVCQSGQYARKSRARDWSSVGRNAEGRRLAYSSTGYVGTGGRELDRTGEPC